MSFKRVDGTLFLIVGLPDGSPGTIPVTATNILGDEPMVETATALSVEGIRELQAVVASMNAPRRSPSGSKRRK
jgi:hypothetical protein